MNLILLTIESQKQGWSEQVIDLYKTKLTQLKINFQVLKLKSPKFERDEQVLKIKKEGDLILRYLKSDDFILALDENGKDLDSMQFSKQLSRAIQSNKKRIIFIVGGAFGLSEEVKTRANEQISLSAMTMNHMVAQTVLLEQIYRGLTILKGIPYHNG